MIFHLGPLDLYKPPFNPINRPWDLSRSIELGQIYFFVDLELHSAYLIPIHAQKVQMKSIFESGLVWRRLVWLYGYHSWISSMHIIHG